MSKSSKKEVDLAELLSTCVDACRRGCEVIRNVRHKSLEDDGGGPSPGQRVQYKVAGDARSALTEADGASQRVIVDCLTVAWPAEIDAGLIRVVGEEDDEGSTDLDIEKCDTGTSDDTGESSEGGASGYYERYRSPRPDVEPIRRDIFGPVPGAVATEDDEVIIFIDPMDGTREFVEGRIHNVQCLIGITVNGLPVGGAVGIMLVHERQIEVLYGLVSHTGDSCRSVLSGSEVFDAINPLAVPRDDVPDASRQDDGEGELLVFSGDSKKPALGIALRHLEKRVLSRKSLDGGGPCPRMRHMVTGGCGNKFYNVQRRRTAAMSIGPPGSCSWDTAAPAAVLLAADPDARVTDLFGRPLVYDGVRLMNGCGVLVSSGAAANEVHARLAEELRGDEELCELVGFCR